MFRISQSWRESFLIWTFFEDSFLTLFVDHSFLSVSILVNLLFILLMKLFHDLSPCLLELFLLTLFRGCSVLGNRLHKLSQWLRKKKKQPLTDFVTHIPTFSHLYTCLCSLSSPSHLCHWLGLLCRYNPGGSIFFTRVQLVDEPSAPWCHYFVLLDELGHSGLSHSIQRRHERNLTF